MASSATFCDVPLSTGLDPLSGHSQVSLDWVMASGISASRSFASGVLTLPSGDTLCSMHMKLSVASGLPYDLVLGRDWVFFFRDNRKLPPWLRPLSNFLDVAVIAISLRLAAVHRRLVLYNL
ncbi:hypothetical protein DFH07DRAFT_1058801 [Mycena maculata]|uniref:Uncharacterized protein n=1 Tax=Mycena maculata TaxID=230809 RepID=A0AAD7JN30_9AGAR|nr:hypothetical protein DFH07DRAFT_1058801 [Mycena maculata]